MARIGWRTITGRHTQTPSRILLKIGFNCQFFRQGRPTTVLAWSVEGRTPVERILAQRKPVNLVSSEK